MSWTAVLLVHRRVASKSPRSHPRSSKKYKKVKLLITAMKAQRTVEDWARGVDGTSTWDAPPPLRCNGAANTYKAHAKSKVIARVI